MKERPILFSAPMVRAILAGAKTQTRRAVKPQPFSVAMVASGNHLFDYRTDLNDYSRVVPMDKAVTLCPYGLVGDRLWVRETWKAHTTFDHLAPRALPRSKIWYLADDGYKAQSRTRASMHMPRWASRITLEITGVRVERLQDITGNDVLAEGCEFPDGDGIEPQQIANRWAPYRDLWESINGPGSWDANPWVWVVEFKRVEA